MLHQDRRITATTAATAVPTAVPPTYITNVNKTMPPHDLVMGIGISSAVQVGRDTQGWHPSALFNFTLFIPLLMLSVTLQRLMS